MANWEGLDINHGGEGFTAKMLRSAFPPDGAG